MECDQRIDRLETMAPSQFRHNITHHLSTVHRNVHCHAVTVSDTVWKCILIQFIWLLMDFMEGILFEEIEW